MIYQEKEHSSFRDRDGFVFYNDASVYRAVHHSYSKEYLTFLSSGLYTSLTKTGFLLPHQEVAQDQWPILPAGSDPAKLFKVLQVERIPYISYPYEWCFHQLKDAALLTLRLQLNALEHNMSLKDASAFNVQFMGGKPVFIDTLSFEIYEEGKPWVAYRQFCTHFLAPLAIMSFVNSDLRRLNQLYIDGIPLSVASSFTSF